MNRQILKAYLEQYKANFERVHLEEIYKWQAIKQFQDTFDIEANDFHSNLETALSKTANLMDSGKYYPRQMLLENTALAPEKVRALFRGLYDEAVDVLRRIEQFRQGIKKLNKEHFQDKKSDYQDHRAVMVYLTLQFPDRYFFYKYNMFKDFAEKVGYSTLPAAGRVSNISHYQAMCELVQAAITDDQKVLKLHKNRISEDCYFDKEFTILTQDFIYAVVEHLEPLGQLPKVKPKRGALHQKIAAALRNKEDKIQLIGRTTDFQKRDKENKRIGELGEQWVLRYERDTLEQKGLAKPVKHDAKEKGDGLGYDILSCSPDGQKKYIEVKTTKGPANAPFYLTRNELERSRMEKDNYYLYRVYHYNEQTEEADLLIIQGELTNLCTVPLAFKVGLEPWE